MTYRSTNKPGLSTFLLIALASASACTSSSVSSDEAARRAYLGLNDSISKSLTLAFQGYDAATSATIPQEMTTGTATGMLVVNGKVDQGNPTQSSMSLLTALTNYSDGPFAVDTKGDKITVTYTTATDSTQPALGVKLNGSSGNAINGTLMGDYDMSGALTGSVTLDVTFVGTFSGSGTAIERVPGSTTVTGTAVNSDGGTYTINAML